MERSWMSNMLDPSRRLRQEFINGVNEFVSKAMDQPCSTLDGGIRCPCMKCNCEKILRPSNVRAHLLQYGFKPNYTVWVEHGEEGSNEGSLNYACSRSENMNSANEFGSVTEMVFDAYMQVADITTHYDNIENHSMSQGEFPNAEAQRFYNMLESANKPIYEGATESTLSVAIRLLAARTNCHATEKCLDYFAQLLVDVAPKNSCIPKNYYEAKKVVSSLGLKAQKIDCCEAGCMLYYKDDLHLTECKFCHRPRYLPPKGHVGRYKNVAVKKMFYLPIIPRLQRLYASRESASQMTWHYENKRDDVLRHPSDGKAWKHFDNVYPDFAADPGPPSLCPSI